MSWCNFLTSLILTHQEIPVEYKLMTCLPKTFPVYSPFPFSLRCLYLAYVLFMTSSLALSSLTYVHLCPNLPLSMRTFKHCRFLCCSMPSFGVSTVSLKKSSSFSMSPTLVIAFIKPRNRYQMKDNIKYNGNTNNTSVIIFLKIQRLPAMLLSLGEPPVRFFVVSSFHFWSSFCCCIFICQCFSFCCCIFICRCSSFCCCIFICWCSSFCCCFFSLLFEVIPHPSVEYRRGFYTPFYTLSPAHRRAIRDTFIFRPFHLDANTAALSGHFLPTGVFTLCLLTCVYQGFRGSRQFFLDVFRASYWLSSKYRRSPSVCLIHSNPQTS